MNTSLGNIKAVAKRELIGYFSSPVAYVFLVIFLLLGGFFTFMVGREFGGRTYPEIGIPEGYHALTHHQYNAEKMAKVVRIQTYHAKHLAYYLDRLRSTPDGDGNLLDHMMVLYGGGISDGNTHLHDNLPVVLLGGASGQVKSGRHIRYKETPMSNLLLTMLDMVGVHQDKLGDSTGRLHLA